PGEDAEDRRAEELGDLQGTGPEPQARDRVRGIEQDHERQVARRRGEEGGEESPPRDVVAVRALEGEDDTRGRGLEDGGHARGGSRGEEGPCVVAAEPPPQPGVDGEAERGTRVDRRPFESQGAARTDG